MIKVGARSMMIMEPAAVLARKIAQHLEGCYASE